MSSVVELWAATLGLTCEELIDSVLAHVSNATERSSDFYATEEAEEEDEVTARSSIHHFAGRIPNEDPLAYLRLPRDARTFYVDLVGLEDGDSNLLPNLFARVTVEFVDSPVPGALDSENLS